MEEPIQRTPPHPTSVGTMIWPTLTHPEGWVNLFLRMSKLPRLGLNEPFSLYGSARVLKIGFAVSARVRVACVEIRMTTLAFWGHSHLFLGLGSAFPPEAGRITSARLNGLYRRMNTQ